MNIHACAKHDFARNIRRFRHLYYLTVDNLVNPLFLNTMANEKFVYDHFT